MRQLEHPRFHVVLDGVSSVVAGSPESTMGVC